MIKAKYLTKITDVSKVFIDKVVKDGDIVVDATMGNGYDTIYLAQIVGDSGKVYSFDIQEQAILSTQKKVSKMNLDTRVELILDGHQNIDKYVNYEISCALFNLGYLPRANHEIITKGETTLQAIKHCLKLLKPNGVISIAIYIGHEGGIEEKNCVYNFIESLDQGKYNVLESKFVNQINNPPQLILIEKKG